MTTATKAKKPFQFYTRFHLSELTGQRAATLWQLYNLLKTVPDAVVYTHTHRSMEEHQYLIPQPPNDFAVWVDNMLGEERLGELLAAIDTTQFTSIRALRRQLLHTIGTYLRAHPLAAFRFTQQGGEFDFVSSIALVLPTPYTASTLEEFGAAIGQVSITSLYYHLFQAPLRLQQATNDFSLWLEEQLNETELAQRIGELNPYVHTLEGLRHQLQELVAQRLAVPGDGCA